MATPEPTLHDIVNIVNSLHLEQAQLRTAMESHSVALGEVQATVNIMQAQLMRTEASDVSFRAELDKAKATSHLDVHTQLARFREGPSSPTAAGSAAADTPKAIAGGGEPVIKKIRAASASPAPRQPDGDEGGAWQKGLSMRPPAASAGRVGGGSSAEDRRTVVVRGFGGSIPRQALPELLAPMLQRLGSRFDRFGGGPAAASAVLLLKTEVSVQAVIKGEAARSRPQDWCDADTLEGGAEYPPRNPPMERIYGGVQRDALPRSSER